MSIVNRFSQNGTVQKGLYHPMKQSVQAENSYVRTQILTALLAMLETQDLSSVSICELTRRAGVGRASFYRNYTSKEDVLQQESDRLTALWGQQFEQTPHSAPNEVLITLLDFYKLHSDFYLALYRAGLSQILLDTILQAVVITPDMPNPLAYTKSAVGYMIYGWVIEWIRRGMQESGTELAHMMESSSPILSSQT